MRVQPRQPGFLSRPRVAFVGPAYDSLRLPLDGLFDALRERIDIQHVDVPAHARSLPSAMLAARRAVRDGCEAVHLLDARLAPAALALRRSPGVPVTVTLSTRDLARRAPWSRLRAAFTGRLDHAFTTDSALAARARLTFPRLPVTTTRAGACPLPEPPERTSRSLERVLCGVAPGQMVVAMPWTGDGGRVRWYRDALLPLLTGPPVCLLLGVPSRRQARLITGAVGTRKHFRLHRGRVDAALLAAAARVADLFLVPEDVVGRLGADALVAMSASGIPLITDDDAGGALQHEHNALITAPRDGFAVVSAMNKLTALPARQRHDLGLEFSDHSLRHLGWEAAADAYAERFAALVGRPQIPENLRAA
jgi:hypothetical protein